MTRPFIVLALPRSRTAWLAHFLGYPPVKCGHDVAVWCESVKDFLDQFESGMNGTVETGAVIAWRLIRHHLPAARIVTIRRSVKEVVESFAKMEIVVEPGYLEERDAMLDMLSRESGVHSLDFKDLNDIHACGWLFEYLLEMEFDPAWWLRLSQVNIQIDMGARMRQLANRQPQLAALKADVLQLSKDLGVSECQRLN